MKEATAKAILKDIVDYMNLSTLEPEAMHLWLLRRLAKRGYDCQADTTDPYNDRQRIILAFSVMGKFSVVPNMNERTRGKKVDLSPCFLFASGIWSMGKKTWKPHADVTFPPVAVEVVFDNNSPHSGFNLKGTGGKGVLFTMRLAALVTNWNKAHRCELCYRYFLSKNAGSAKWCHNSCKTMNSRINTGKHEWDKGDLYWFKLRKREDKILEEARKLRKREDKILEEAKKWV